MIYARVLTSTKKDKPIYGKIMETYLCKSGKRCRLKIIWPREKIETYPFDNLEFLTTLPSWLQFELI